MLNRLAFFYQPFVLCDRHIISPFLSPWTNWSFFCVKISIFLHLFASSIFLPLLFSVHFPKFSPPLHFLPSDLPQSLLRRICFVTPSNKGTQKRRKNEQGTKEERTKWVPEGGNDVAQTRVRKRMRIKKYFTRYTLFDYVIKIYNLYLWQRNGQEKNNSRQMRMSKLGYPKLSFFWKEEFLIGWDGRWLHKFLIYGASWQSTTPPVGLPSFQKEGSQMNLFLFGYTLYT